MGLFPMYAAKHIVIDYPYFYNQHSWYKDILYYILIYKLIQGQYDTILYPFPFYNRYNTLTRFTTSAVEPES